MRSYNLFRTNSVTRPMCLEIYDDGEFIDSRNFKDDDPERIELFARDWVIHGRGVY